MLTREFDDSGVVLSGGELQKIAVARAFCKNFQIIILDEPSSALDPIAEYQLFESMMEACHSKIVIFISHRLSSAVLADIVYLLEDGKVIEQGSHRELMAQNGKYAELFRKQAEKYLAGADHL
jgi:ATP-binding cassette subfamily B protein